MRLRRRSSFYAEPFYLAKGYDFVTRPQTATAASTWR